MKVKSPRDQYNIKGAIYSIPCEYGKECVGETRRTLHQRMTEHKQAVRNEDIGNALAVHVSKTHYTISWEEAKVLAKEVLAKEEQWTKRKIKEALAIREKHKNLNLDQVSQVDVNWFTYTGL